MTKQKCVIHSFFRNTSNANRVFTDRCVSFDLRLYGKWVINNQEGPGQNDLEH